MLHVLCGIWNEGGGREGEGWEEGMVRTDAFEDEVWPLVDGLVGGMASWNVHQRSIQQEEETHRRWKRNGC